MEDFGISGNSNLGTFTNLGWVTGRVLSLEILAVGSWKNERCCWAPNFASSQQVDIEIDTERFDTLVM